MLCGVFISAFFHLMVSPGTFSAYLPPPPHLVSGKKYVFNFHTASFVVGSVSYIIMNYSVLFGHFDCLWIPLGGISVREGEVGGQRRK